MSNSKTYQSVDEVYLIWLYNEVSSVETTNPPRTYWNLMRQMYKREFIWFVPNDDNRAEDGKGLRHEFLADHARDNIEFDQYWLDEGCSVLEMLVSVAKKLAFLTGEPIDHWFWRMIRNLGLIQFSDGVYREKKVEDILDRLIWRTYDYNGSGGLFPLESPEEDQRDVEIWYQLNAYLLEML